ncbi:MAG: porin [Gammaproteobacteria bacterium]|jgi:predicted porin|nr:porin [Gammaproteobacteria bacterium]MBT4606619.1 porin [Thiotrichales bacterium]MBT5466658.1 porin [Candidatus Neomarinimicrobiota bacterium]MBT5688625.1 porin [Gammaproteobacteria bacterium]
MFKKAIIAVAMAAVTGSAMADVTVGGKVEQQQRKNEAGEWSGWSDVRLTVSGSEDLGNGMSGFFKFQEEIGLRSGAGAQQYDQLVGLKSGAGTLIMGKVEDFTESKVMSMTDKTMGANGVEIGANLGRNEGAIAYVSPSFSGLTVGVAGYALSASGGDQDAFDAVDLGLMYSNGPLSVNVAFENDKRAATAATAATAAFDSGDSTSIGASYAAGDLTVAATQQMTSYDTAGKADEDDTSIAVTYNMGNNKVVVGWNDNETSAGATVTDTNSNVIELQHSFSKTTAAYVQFYNTDVAAGDTTSFGLQHSF